MVQNGVKYDENVYKLYKSDTFSTSKFYFNSTVNNSIIGALVLFYINNFLNILTI